MPTLTPTPDHTTSAGILQMAQAYVPNGDANTAMVRLVYAQIAQKYLPELLDDLSFYDNQHVWMVTMWIPPTDVPDGTSPKPNADADVVGQFFLFDAHTGNLMTTHYISSQVLNVMGWLADDTIDLSNIQN